MSNTEWLDDDAYPAITGWRRQHALASVRAMLGTLARLRAQVAAAAVTVTREAMNAPCEQTPVTWERPDRPMPPIRPGRYLDPAILHGLVRPALSPAPRQTIHVPRPMHDYAPGERIEISSSSVDQLAHTVDLADLRPGASQGDQALHRV